MNRNPNQRKVITPQKLQRLREEVCQAYFKSKGGEEELMTPKSKESPYYKDLREDIFKKTKKDISTGTLVKFFHQEITDKDVKYRIITIETVEEYIRKVLYPSEVKKKTTELEEKMENQLATAQQENMSPEIKAFAKRIYIELTTRKAALPIDEDKDVIVEIYDSWYKLFCIIRDEMHTLPISCFKENPGQESIGTLSLKLLNETLRPHLTEHQAKFRTWFENAKRNPKNKNLTPQELQKRYPDYKNIWKSIKQVNEALIERAKHFLS